MKIRWRLRTAAAQREVWTGTELRRLLAEKAGLEFSSASVSALEATRLRHLRGSRRIPRPPALLPVSAPDRGTGGQGDMPGLWQGPRAAAGHRPVRHMLPRLRRMRPSSPLGRYPAVPGLPPQSRADRSPADVLALRQARRSARRHRLVRSLFPAGASRWRISGTVSVIGSRLRARRCVLAGRSGAVSAARAVRKARASMARVMCRCHEVQCLTW